MKKIALAGIIAWIMALFVVASAPAMADGPEVLVTVNGAAIDKPTFENIFAKVVKQISKGNEQGLEGKQQTLRKAILEQLILKQVMLDRAAKDKITVTDADIDEQLKQIKQQFPSEAAFNEALKRQDLTIDAARQDIREKLTIQKLVSANLKETTDVPGAEVEAFYQDPKNEQLFSEPEKIHALHILIKVSPSASDADVAVAKKRAQNILFEAKSGKDFSELAKKYSEDDSTKIDGGDLGFFGRGQMTPEFEKAAFSLNPGDISGLVRTEFGFHIIKLLEKKPAGKMLFHDVRDKIKEYLITQKNQDTLNTYLESLRKEADIKILDKDVATWGLFSTRNDAQPATVKPAP